MIRVSTKYLHMAVLVGKGNLTKGEIKTFEKIVKYIQLNNTDPFL